MSETEFAIVQEMSDASVESTSNVLDRDDHLENVDRDQSISLSTIGPIPDHPDRSEDIENLLDQLSSYRRRLHYRLKQKAISGVSTPTDCLSDIEEARTEIKRIKQELRNIGEIVDDKPFDESDTDSIASSGQVRFLIDEKYCKKTSTVYIAPPNTYNDALTILRDKHILVLCGRAEMGLRMTAIHLLQAQQIEKIYQWNPGTELSILQTVQAQEPQAHLIHQMKLDAQAHLGKYELDQLSNQLKPTSYLVITIEDTSSLIRQQIKDYLVTWNERPDNPNSLLINHLSWHTSELHIVDRVQEICRYVDTQFQMGNWSPGSIDRLALQLVKADGNEAKIRETLDAFAHATESQITDWFTGHTDLEHFALMMALAVLGGAKTQTIMKATLNLLARLKPTATEGEPQEAPLLFDRPRQQWLDICRARFVPDRESTAFGDCRLERIEFIDPMYSPSIIDHVWREYPHFHQPILKWLREMIDGVDAKLRERAAHTIGKLSTYDFDAVYSFVLLPYAKQPKPYAPGAVANILSVLLSDEQYRSHALEILHQWSTREKTPTLHQTAAVIYGKYIGMLFLEQALDDLRVLAQQANSRTSNAVRTSVTDLFYFGLQRDNSNDQTLKVLLDWSSSPKDSAVMKTGLQIFLKLTDYGLIGDDGEAWPTLLWLQHSDPQQRETIAVLWQRALNVVVTREDALKKLRRWLSLADKQPYIYPAVNQLLSDLAGRGTAREKERLCFHLRKWASSYKQKVASAEKILAAIC